jgi:2-polyprenyl-3-methyl-5-hydroxy-6-metoxy-1,4-benzoquinol methylase
MQGETSNKQVLLRQELADLCKLHGPWSTHDVHLGEQVYTRSEKGSFDAQSACYMQTVADVLQRPFADLRMVDLGCLEGKFALDMAAAGAAAVGIEGRASSLAKASFARDKLGLDRAEFVQDDARNLSVEKYGKFDVVLCSGLLYHLDEPDVFKFAENLRQVCTGVTLIDTHVALYPLTRASFRGRDYFGWKFREHAAAASEAQKMKDIWASLDNEFSFFLTRASLYNLLSDVGFTTVFEVHSPAVTYHGSDRIILAAIPGKQQTPLHQASPRWEEVNNKSYLETDNPLIQLQRAEAMRIGLDTDGTAPFIRPDKPN